MELTICRSAGRFRDLRREWNDLAQACPDSTVFQTWEWNHCWWGAYGRSSLKARLNAELRILEVRDGGDLVGLMPLWRSRRRKALRFIGEHSTDYLMPLIRPDRAAEVLAALSGHLLAAAAKDAVELIDIPADHPFVTAFPEGARREGSLCPRVALPSSAEDLLAGISSNLRHSIRKGEREILQSGRGRFLPAGEPGQDYDLFEGLYSMRAQVKGLAKALNDPSRAAFWRSFCVEAGPLLRLLLLEVDGRPACGILCFHFKGVTSYYAQGMDPQYAPLAPGNLTLWTAVRGAIAEDAQVFDFLRGNEEFKQRWRPEVRRNVDVVLGS